MVGKMVKSNKYSHRIHEVHSFYGNTIGHTWSTLPLKNNLQYIILSIPYLNKNSLP